MEQENCTLCESIRKGEQARSYVEKRTALLARQRMEPIDHNENLISIGDTIAFLTLYGYRKATVNSISKDHGGYLFHFDPMQIGPKPAWKPVSKWHLNYNQQVCVKN
jgi:hypothetical protein